MTGDAAFWVILEEVQRGLREDLRFETQPGDTTPGIASNAIVIRKLSRETPTSPAKTEEAKPGWLIVPGNVSIPANEGTNVQEDCDYSILLQLIATEYEKGISNLRSYLKWQEQVARYLNHWFAHDQINTDFGCVRESVATRIMTVDETRFIRHHNFVAGVELHVFALENRGAS